MLPDKHKLYIIKTMLYTKLLDSGDVLKYIDGIILNEESIPDWLADISLCSEEKDLFESIDKAINSGIELFDIPKNNNELFIASALISNDLKKLKLRELIKIVNSKLYYGGQDIMFEIKRIRGKFIDKLKNLFEIESSKREINTLFYEIKGAQQGDAPEPPFGRPGDL